MTIEPTISVSDDAAAEARDAVRAGRAASVSGCIVTAVQHYRQAMTLEEWLAQANADAGGPPSAEVFARIDPQLRAQARERERATPGERAHVECRG